MNGCPRLRPREWSNGQSIWRLTVQSNHSLCSMKTQLDEWTTNQRSIRPSAVVFLKVMDRWDDFLFIRSWDWSWDRILQPQIRSWSSFINTQALMTVPAWVFLCHRNLTFLFLWHTDSLTLHSRSNAKNEEYSHLPTSCSISYGSWLRDGWMTDLW